MHNMEVLIIDFSENRSMSDYGRKQLFLRYPGNELCTKSIKCLCPLHCAEKSCQIAVISHLLCWYKAESPLHPTESSLNCTEESSAIYLAFKVRDRSFYYAYLYINMQTSVYEGFSRYLNSADGKIKGNYRCRFGM